LYGASEICFTGKFVHKFLCSVIGQCGTITKRIINPAYPL
jgi:hypothetical protein